MSLRQQLQKRKNAGVIDFMEVPLDWGNGHKEFIGFDLDQKSFFRLFFSGKYRQDTFTPNIKNQEKLLSEIEKGLTDIGIYNTREEFNQKQKEVDFIKKYNKLCT